MVKKRRFKRMAINVTLKSDNVIIVPGSTAKHMQNVADSVNKDITGFDGLFVVALYDQEKGSDGNASTFTFGVDGAALMSAIMGFLEDNNMLDRFLQGAMRYKLSQMGAPVIIASPDEVKDLLDGMSGKKDDKEKTMAI